MLLFTFIKLHYNISQSNDKFKSALILKLLIGGIFMRQNGGDRRFDLLVDSGRFGVLHGGRRSRMVEKHQHQGQGQHQMHAGNGNLNQEGEFRLLDGR